MDLQPRTKTFEMGGQTFTLETGRIARQATGAVLVTSGETAVLGTVVGAKEAKPGQGFFPLTVNYIEKTYAVGKIPGGFFKREGRPSEKETLTSRLIDRPIRPLFPEGFMNEVQVICTVMSASKEQDPDIAAMLAASAALAISGIPFEGPIGAARVGFTDDKGYFLNPTFAELESSLLDMVVAGTEDAVLMVESEAKGLTEDPDARGRSVRASGNADGHQGHQGIRRRSRQAALGLAARAGEYGPAERAQGGVRCRHRGSLRHP